jgi:TolB-like protein
MMRYVTIAAICIALSFPAAAGPKTDNHVKVALLPVKQNHMSKIASVSDERLSAALHVEFTKAADFELVESSEFQEQFQDQIVEDALFELLVTDNLAQTLRTLDASDTDAGKHKSYAETAKQLHIQYLAEVTLEGHRDRTEINYKLTDTANSRVMLAKSFAHVSDDAGSIARETAKRLMRDLWRLRHSNN